jgi:short-subunit dehydrogenase involved in D-alanine esterification of teichoic acids
MQTTGNSVLITGGASGIGLALARKFLSMNNKVIIISRNQPKLDSIKAALPDITIEQADITDIHNLEHIAQKYPKINILINNAGIQYNYDFTDRQVTTDLIDIELRTNLIAPLQLTLLMIPHLLTKQSAAIINVTSGLALVPKQSAPVYCSSKAGLHIASKSLRWQLEPTQIKIFEIIAPLVDTPMTQGRLKGKIQPDILVEEFWRNFSHDHYEMLIGKSKLLYLLQRFLPQLAEKIMRPGL